MGGGGRGGELFALVLLKRSVNQFPFIHLVTFNFARSYRRTIVASDFEVFRSKKQFCLLAVRGLGFPFKMNVQLGLGLKVSKTALQYSRRRRALRAHL